MVQMQLGGLCLDSPPDRDIQWSNEGVAAAHKFVQRIWSLNENSEKREIKSVDADEKIYQKQISIYKITNLIEKFQLNVAIATIYEAIRFMEENLRKNVKNQHFLLSQSNLMKAIMPFMPHISCECLSRLEGKNFFSKVEWPKIQKTFLVEDEVVIVVQVNGKKRGLFSTKKNINEIDAIKEAKKIENIEKNLKNKKIIKKIFVKNKIINFITS